MIHDGLLRGLDETTCCRNPTTSTLPDGLANILPIDRSLCAIRAGARLIDMVVAPHALVESRGALRLHAQYYINKQIVPTLDRALSLVGADVLAWFAALPRPQARLGGC